MLGKLLKHEWKSTWKVPTLLIVVLMVAAVLAGLPFMLPIWESDWVGLPLSAMMLILLFYAVMIAVSVGVVIYFAVRYYKSMYTDEGYLIHTLPVKAHEIFFSKFITMSAWNLLTGVAVILSLCVFLFVMIVGLAAQEGGFAVDLVEALSELEELLHSPYLKGFGGFLISLICMALASTAGGTSLLLGAIDLGQMLRKHRVLGAIGAYFAFYSVIQVITFIMMFPFLIKQMLAMEKMEEEMSLFSIYIPIYSGMAVLYTVVAVGLSFLSVYLIRRKLELE